MTAAPASTTVYFHGDCLDGFGAAYAAWRRLGDAARYLPVHYGDTWRPTDVAGRDVFVLDFTFPRAELLAMTEHARSVQLIDHHATALHMWQDVLGVADTRTARYRDEARRLGLHFDLDKSGARLAWEHFHPGAPLPTALAHIEDQDLWRFRLEGTRSFCRALRLRPFVFPDWDQVVCAADVPDHPAHLALLAEGRSIERFLATEIARLATGSLVTPVVLRGEPLDPLQSRRHGLPLFAGDDGAWRAVPGLAVNANALFASELGHRLAERSGTYGLVWQVAADGIVRASLRACGAVDVARLAESYGGGGHPNAAGFRMPLPRFTAEVLAQGGSQTG